MKFNVNDCVKVKLTEKGISILKSQYADLQRDCPSVTTPFHFEMDENAYRIKAICTVKISGRTGVEMEALTGVSVALLTIYDMCKAIDKRMVMTDIRLVRKTGGKSGDFYA